MIYISNIDWASYVRSAMARVAVTDGMDKKAVEMIISCLLYTSPSPRDVEESRMPSSA